MEDILYFIDHHEKLLRWMKPMYARKPGLNRNQTVVNQVEQEIREQQNTSQKVMKDAAETAVLKNIVQIEDSLANGRNNDAQLACERSLRQMRKVTLAQVPRKFEFIIDMIHYHGVALMRQKLYDEAIDAFRREIKMGQKLYVSPNELMLPSISWLTVTFFTVKMTLPYLERWISWADRKLWQGILTMPLTVGTKEWNMHTPHWNGHTLIMR